MVHPLSIFSLLPSRLSLPAVSSLSSSEVISWAWNCSALAQANVKREPAMRATVRDIIVSSLRLFLRSRVIIFPGVIFPRRFLSNEDTFCGRSLLSLLERTWPRMSILPIYPHLLTPRPAQRRPCLSGHALSQALPLFPTTHISRYLSRQQQTLRTPHHLRLVCRYLGIQTGIRFDGKWSFLHLRYVYVSVAGSA